MTCDLLDDLMIISHLVNISLSVLIHLFFSKRWWSYLLPYAGVNIVLLYIYQLPFEFSDAFKWLAEFIGFYKISSQSALSESCSGISVLLFYILVRTTFSLKGRVL